MHAATVIDRLYYPVVLATIFTFSSGLSGYTMPVLLLLIVADVIVRNFRWVPTTLDRPLVALLVVCFASGITSPWRWPSVGIAAMFALMVLVSVYPAARVIRARPDALQLIIAVWIAGALFAAAWGIMRAPGEWPSGASTPALGRNALGTTMVAAIALALATWTVWDKIWIRITMAASLLVFMTALALTTSRSAWIAVVVGVTVMIALAPRRRAWLVGLCLAPIIFAVVVTGVQRPLLLHKLESILSVEANEDRVAIWRAVPKMVRDHPLLGTGYGTFVNAWPLYEPDPALAGKPTAHNVFLNFAAETGLLGLAAFLTVLGVGFAGLWRQIQSSRGDPRTDGLWVGLFAAIVGMLFQQLFDGTVMSWHVGYGLLASLALAGAKPVQRAADYETTPA